MTIECHKGECPHHDSQTVPDSGPFCSESECLRRDLFMIQPIHYWPDGTWCEPDELEQMTHMSDDYRTFDAGGATEFEIDDMVERLVADEMKRFCEAMNAIGGSQ